MAKKEMEMKNFKNFDEYWDSRLPELEKKYPPRGINFLYDESLRAWEASKKSTHYAIIEKVRGGSERIIEVRENEEEASIVASVLNFKRSEEEKKTHKYIVRKK